MIKLIKFSLIGGIGLIINLVVAYVLKEFMGLWYFWAFMLGVLFNWTFNFLANSYITFRGHSKEKYAIKYATFLSIYLVALAVNSGLVYTMTSVLNIYYLVSIAVAAGITTLITFSSSRRLVYHDK